MSYQHRDKVRQFVQQARIQLNAIEQHNTNQCEGGVVTQLTDMSQGITKLSKTIWDSVPDPRYKGHGPDAA